MSELEPEPVELVAEPRHRGRLEWEAWRRLRQAFVDLDPGASPAEVDAAAGAGALLFGYELPRHEERHEPGALEPEPEPEPGALEPEPEPEPDAGR